MRPAHHGYDFRLQMVLKLLRGLEAGLEGMAIGATKRGTGLPADGYGETHPEGFCEVQRDRVPLEAQRVGAKLETTAPDGRVVFPYVAEITPAWEHYPTDDLEADTAEMNRRLEQWIAPEPGQYYWVHKRFKTRPEGEPGLY